MAAADYVELRCRSAFSFLDGASLPEDLVEEAAAQGHDTLALADTNGVYGAPRFFGAAKRAGLRALVGAEVTLEAAAGGAPAPPPVLLLVESRAGYKNLCRLLTAAHLGHPKGQAVASHALLAEHAAGLIALAGAAPRDDLPALLAAFGGPGDGGRVYLEVQRHLDAVEAHRVRAALDQARALGVPVVATNDVRYATPARRRVHDVLTCARLHLTVDEVGRRLAPSAERRLKPPAEMADLFRDMPRAVRASRAIAERCAFTLGDLGYTFPRFPVPGGDGSAGSEQAYLEAQVWARAPARFLSYDDAARRQLARELAIIGKLDLAGYFLVVWDIVEIARREKIMIQGRGSAANSAVCYALGITAIDPVRMDLLFERFLSEERVRCASSIADRMPDIDLDLPSGAERETIIQHVYRRYGARGAAMTANVISYRPRMAVRDCGRALGFSEQQLGKISKQLPGWIHQDDRPLAAFLADAGFPVGEDRTRLLGEIATAMLNLPRHLGQHSGGMVIAAGALEEVVPLEPASMPDRVVVQWDKDDCADMGIVKVDLLGLGMMAVLEDAVPLIRRHEGVEVDYAHLPPDDPQVFALLRAADTIGLFQVESRAQMATLPRMKPTCFYDLVVEVAIIRPGPIVGKMVNPYLERRAKRAPVVFPHPSLEPILKRTLGVPLFQEQLIRMAMVAAGFTGGQAEELRRAMGFKRSEERMNVIEKDLRAGMNRNGIHGAAQEEIVQGIKSFALYGFPESHAASFALLAYASAYLKVYHPAAFTCALLNNYPLGFYHPATLVNDAVRHGVAMLPVDVARSGWLCDLEGEGKQGKPGVRLGLKVVSGLRQELGRRIEAARAAGPFASLADFEDRVRPEEAELRTLATAGALAALGGTRRQALWQVEALGRSGRLFAGEREEENPGPSPRPDSPRRRRGEGDGASRNASTERGALTNLQDQVTLAPVCRGEGGVRGPGCPLPEMSPHDEMLADFATTGLTTGPHPMAFVRARLEAEQVLPAAALAGARDGSRVRVAGVTIVRQRPGTAKGFVFITLEDETGFSNAIVTPDMFETHRRAILNLGSMIIEGTVQNRDGVVLIKADRFLPLPGRPHDITISHDFH